MFLSGSVNACRLFDLRRAAWFTVSALLSVIRQNSLICNILLLLYCNVGREQNWRRRSKHKKHMTSLQRHSIRRHVGGIAYLCENKEWAERKSENSCATVICRPCISTGLLFHSQQFASMRKLQRHIAAVSYTSNMAAVTIVNRITSLSPRLYINM